MDDLICRHCHLPIREGESFVKVSEIERYKKGYRIVYEYIHLNHLMKEIETE